MDKTQIEPSESLTDNLTHDIVDSIITGVAATLAVQYFFGRNPSFKNVLSKNVLVDGMKMGVGIGAYRRLGRPAINTIMNRTPGLDGIMKL